MSEGSGLGRARYALQRGRPLLIAVAAALGAAILSTAPASGEATRAERNLAIVQRMEAAYESDDCGTVLKLGVPLVDAKGGIGLPDEAVAYAYDVVTGCEALAKDLQAAYRHALKGTGLEGSSDYLWRTRFAIELKENRYEAAVATVEAMLRGRGAALNSIPEGWMWRLEQELQKAGLAGPRRRLIEALADNSYAPEEAYGPVDGFRLEYAALLAAAGETEKARAVVATLETPSTLAEASLDPRLRGFFTGEPDVRAAAERSLARHREAFARHPDRIQPLLLVSADLRQLGRPADALRLLQSVAPRIDDPDAFADIDDKRVWWWNELASIHAELGHYDDAVAALRKAAAMDEDGRPNVSQVINLANLQTRYGHGEEALKTLAVFDDPGREMSPYGRVALHYQRGCAKAVAGRPGDAAEDLAFVRAHEKDAEGTLAHLLLCLGDMDGAAASYIAQLDDPDRRSAILLRLSDYDDPPVRVPLGAAETRLLALKQRADVKAAIARAGGTRRFRVQE